MIEVRLLSGSAVWVNGVPCTIELEGVHRTFSARTLGTLSPETRVTGQIFKAVDSFGLVRASAYIRAGSRSNINYVLPDELIPQPIQSQDILSACLKRFPGIKLPEVVPDFREIDECMSYLREQQHLATNLKQQG